MMQFDSLQNVLAQVGMGNDKAAHARYSGQEPSPEQIEAAYASSWAAGRVVDAPVDGALSKWRNWLGEPELVDRLEAIETRIKLRQTLVRAMKLARLQGGAAVFIGTNIKNLSYELQPTERVRFLSILNSSECHAPQLSTADKLEQGEEPEHYQVSGRTVHRSRLIILKGAHCPHSPHFGKSELATPFGAIKDADSVAANIAGLVWEAKVDVFKIPDLMASLGDPAYENRLLTRLSLANAGKSITNSLLMDAEEDYEQKSFNFAGLQDLLITNYRLVASAAGMPASIFLGESAPGLNATGEEDTRDYYDSLIAMQSSEIGPELARLDKLMIAEAGAEHAEYKWAPLWQPTAKEAAEILAIKAGVLDKLADLQVVGDDTLIEAARQLMGEDIPALEEARDNDF